MAVMMDVESSHRWEEPFNGQGLVQQRLEMDNSNETLSTTDSSVNESAFSRGDTDTSFNQEQSGQAPQAALPGGFQCGGANFYSFEFGEKLFRSLPFMISQPKNRFLRSWATDTEILPKLGVPLDFPIKREPEDINAELRMARNKIRREMRPQKVKKIRPEKVEKIKSAKETTFQCEDCPEIFQRRRLLRHHVGMVHLKSFNCPKCSRMFSSPTNAKRHSLTCKGIREKREVKAKQEITFQCEDCPESFQRRRLLRLHVGMVHLESFNCPKCSRLFSSPTNANRHSLTCKGIREKREVVAKVDNPAEKRWKCLVCDKKLSTVPRVNRHFQTLHPNEDPAASVASISGEETFKVKVEVDDDDNAVVANAKYQKRQMCQCNICGKTATRYSNPKSLKFFITAVLIEAF